MASSDIAALVAPPCHDPLLVEIVRRLVAYYQPEKVYLFGSTARGQAGADSDYDILVVVPDEAPPEQRSTRHVYAVLWDIRASIDVLVWSHAEFAGDLPLRASFPSTVIREGRLLYAT
jgi:predicted nucleotidyltransferase